MNAPDLKPMRVDMDVEKLPSVVFGHRGMMWWGTLGFVVIEGYTLAIAVSTYLYLRLNFQSWPPLGTPEPSLTIPTIQLVLMLVSLAPMYWTDHAARRFDRPKVRVGLVICSVLAVVMVVLRWYEFWALNTRWDSNAYGSIQWTTVGLHATLLVIEMAETIGMALIMFSDRLPARLMSDTSDNAFYWYFLVLLWVPLYVLVYLGPRFL